MLSLSRIKILLDKENDDSVDDVLSTLISMCKEEAVDYCNLQEYTDKLDNAVTEMVIERFNLKGVENLKEESSSGVSASFYSFYSNRVVKMLNKQRKVRVV